MRYMLSLSLPPKSIPGRDSLVLLLREANEQRGLLIAALYEGRLTYSEFAAQRMKMGDQFVATLSGTASPRQATEQAVPAPLNISPSPAISSTSQLREGDEVVLERRGNSYLVPVAVNGLPPMGFILDTGADNVSLPAEVVFTLLRTGTLQSTDFIGKNIYRLADGRELPSFNFKIRQLQVGRHVIRNVVGSLNTFGADPLLGGSFLSRFAQWKIDNQRNLLILAQ
jgi:predicted aspartyl protease